MANSPGIVRIVTESTVFTRQLAQYCAGKRGERDYVSICVLFYSLGTRRYSWSLVVKSAVYLWHLPGIPRHPEFWRNRYFVAVLRAGICAKLAQAKDGFAVDFPMISKHRLLNIK